MFKSDKNNGNKLKAIFLLTIAIILLLFCTGCSWNREISGFEPRDIEFSKIEKGVSSKESIMEMLGAPNLTSEDGYSYYYIRQEVSRFPQLPPSIGDFYAIAFHFDDNGILREYQEYDKSDMGSLDFYKGETEAPIRDKGFFSLFKGKVGQFKNAAEEQI